MDQDSSQVGWTDEQWNRVRRAVAEEAHKARVAASFLPIVGPLDPDVEVVSAQMLNTADAIPPPFGGVRFAVDDSVTYRLTTIATTLYLRTAQMKDPELSSALLLFRRAANLITRVEDAVIFNGLDPAGTGLAGAAPPIPPVVVPPPMVPAPAVPAPPVPPLFTLSGERSHPGLLTLPAGAPGIISVPPPAPATAVGQAIFTAIVRAITQLEGNGHFGPFACVLGNQRFEEATTPDTGSMVLARDRILPFLDGPLLRSSTLQPKQGVVVALGSQLVDLVVASDMSVRFLQATAEPRFLFRLAERIALRVKDPSAIAILN